jgi:hypothetical protein
MPLQSTGAISLANIQTEFGGSDPISINEYYLNGIYTTGTGATGIPTSGTISLNNFYGKSKVVTSVVPTAVATSFTGTYTTGPGGGQYGSGYEAITGVSGTNLSRSDVATFNNIGSTGIGRTTVLTYMNLILQARVGNTIRITVQVVTLYGDNETIRVYINFGGGYFIIGSTNFNGSATYNYDYTIPAGTAAGNYSICCTNDYNVNVNSGYTTVNYYSLHIF